MAQALLFAAFRHASEPAGTADNPTLKQIGRMSQLEFGRVPKHGHPAAGDRHSGLGPR